MNAQTQQVMFSSKSSEWTTPKAFFDKLDRIFGPFTLDPCCDGTNNLTQHYFRLMKKARRGIPWLSPSSHRGQIQNTGMNM